MSQNQSTAAATKKPTPEKLNSSKDVVNTLGIYKAFSIAQLAGSERWGVIVSLIKDGEVLSQRLWDADPDKPAQTEELREFIETKLLKAISYEEKIR
jgi:hypothetical protein